MTLKTQELQIFFVRLYVKSYVPPLFCTSPESAFVKTLDESFSCAKLITLILTNFLNSCMREVLPSLYPICGSERSP